eukprot:CAMPEP_0171261210 /NCGR_PEP_ID=MMETSP0790-20130122/55871_1 /TAXON_ID=2925 /ORGANISM="Alexandrium catenella, Strain OF101" /LENGTH=230 /DNA_ID=CAMNT_0011729599 /DNA_START=102 /DNA_END=794 /DNA_ORIENTATION=+
MTENILEWTAEDVAKYFTSKGYGAYAELWVKHRVNGDRMVMLQPKDIQDMGVTLVGDRIGIQKELRAFKGQARLADRNKVLCQYKQAYPGSDCQRAMYDSVWKCCFPREADMYILTSTLLKIRKYHVRRLVGAVKCGGCLGGDWEHDTIPLDKITDVDTMTTTVGVGMFKTAKCHIFLSAMAGGDATSQVARVEKHTLFVEESDGEKFADEIRHRVAEYKLELAGQHDSV